MNTFYFIVLGLIVLLILAIAFRKTLKKIWFKIPGFEGGLETHSRSDFDTDKTDDNGIIAEWMEPDWFKFAGGSYSNLIPVAIEIWLQVYFRNTTNEPHTLQSASVSFSRQGRFWGGYFGGIQPSINGHINGQMLPKAIPAKDSIPLFFQYVFSIAAVSPDDFIAQIKEAPELVFKINYLTKEGPNTPEKSIERSLNFKEEYPKIYRSFLAGVRHSEGQRLTDLLG